MTDLDMPIESDFILDEMLRTYTQEKKQREPNDPALTEMKRGIDLFAELYGLKVRILN